MRSITYLAIVAALVAGCSRSPSNQAKARWTIGMSQCNLGEPWRVQMNADVHMAAAKHPEIKVVYKDAQNEIGRASCRERVSNNV
jgi:ribose transport system substrate-binding protein